MDKNIVILLRIMFFMNIILRKYAGLSSDIIDIPG